MAEKKHSDYPDATQILETTKFLVLEGSTPVNKNVPRNLLRDYIQSLVGSPISYTWANRPLIGNRDGDKILISDIGSIPQVWVWQDNRWMPTLGKVLYKLPTRLSLPQHTNWVILHSISLPAGLLRDGSIVSLETTVFPDQGGPITPNHIPASAFDFEFYAKDTVSNTFCFINRGDNVQANTFMYIKGKLSFVTATRGLANPYNASGYGYAGFVTVDAVNTGNPIDLQYKFRKSNATDLIEVLDGIVELYI